MVTKNSLKRALKSSPNRIFISLLHAQNEPLGYLYTEMSIADSQKYVEFLLS